MALTQVPIELSSTPGIVDNSNATAITIDSSENVGIGATSPTAVLDVRRGDASGAVAEFHTSTGFGIELGSSQSEAYIQAGSNQALLFNTNTSNERMRITSAGNLLVGKTSTSIGDAGHTIFASGEVFHTVAGTPLYVNRTGSDGPIQNFYKDGAGVGIIGTSSGKLTIGNADTGLLFDAGSDNIYPWNTSTNVKRDAVIDLGFSSNRFDTLFATNSTINTSDRNEKQDIEDLSDAEKRVAVAAKSLLRKYRWKSAVADKGDDARIHFGIIAQDLQDAFTAEGLDAARYAMFCSDTWTNDDGSEQTRLGVRYSELLAFIISAI